MGGTVLDLKDYKGIMFKLMCEPRLDPYFFKEKKTIKEILNKQRNFDMDCILKAIRDC